MLNLIKQFLILMVFVTATVSAAGKAKVESQWWVWPRYKTEPAIDKKLTIVDRYHYSIAKYDPPYTILKAVDKKQARFNTPEEVMISRISAMMNGDYSGWLENWDHESQLFIAERNKQDGEDSQSWTTLWKDRFRFMRFKLLRRIETGPYVVITYTLVTTDGKDVANNLEMPVIFRKFDQRWYATQELNADALIASSPWVSGKDKEEITVQ